MLDLYAGTGSIGIEALSRGAAHVTFVEANRTALRLVQLTFNNAGGLNHPPISAPARSSQFFRRMCPLVRSLRHRLLRSTLPH